MKSLWSNEEARRFEALHAGAGRELALRVYTARLIGADTTLVMHGGGNCSVKVRRRTILGDEVEAICVKGSGWDLDSIEPPGFPALELEPLRALRSLDRLSDEEMVNQTRRRLFDSQAPNPSVEALLHAFLPQRFIDHTHADAILALTNQPDPEALVRAALGDRVAIVPYVMPGFELARVAADCLERHPGVEGLVLLKHGLFTFGDDARTSYERTIDLVDRAERFLVERGGALRVSPPGGDAVQGAARAAARLGPILRGRLATRGTAADGWRRIVLDWRGSAEVLALLGEPGCEDLARRGPLTPDHVIRTKATPLLLSGLEVEGSGDEQIAARLETEIAGYREAYQAYFKRNVGERAIEPLDPEPRVILVPGVGLFASGRTRKDAAIAADIAEHTLRIKATAERVGRYEALPEADLFDMEYWSLELAKLGREVEKPLARCVAMVTGAAGAIGVGIALELAQAGAQLVLTDVDEGGLERARERVAAVTGRLGCIALRMDVTSEESVRYGFDEACRAFGGVDVVVPNAGIAHVSALADTDDAAFRRVLDVNLRGYFLTMREGARVLRSQATGGSIVINSSKNVFGPGADFGAYSASKAAGHQLGKVAAIELAPLGVRVNMINADAVFAEGETASGLWQAIGPDRARSKGLAPGELEEHYRQRNLLGVRISGRDVGRAVVFLAGTAVRTTGATLPVDGGVVAAFPR